MFKPIKLTLCVLAACGSLTSAGLAAASVTPVEATNASVQMQLDDQRQKMSEALAAIRASGSPEAAQGEGAHGIRVTDQGVIGLKEGQGVVRMQELMRAIHGENLDPLDEQTRQAIEGAQRSANHAVDMNNYDPSTVIKMAETAPSWQKQMLESYVAGLPPRDQALGRSILLGDGTVPGVEGQLYFFVSRSMPMSMLRAYAMDAMYAGATLVVKGIRKGDTVKDYVMEMLEDYNSADGQVLAGMEINPNLFDMFEVEVVPTVVWTNRIGLNDVGSGCVAPPDFAAPKMTVEGPQGAHISVEKPYCMPVSETSYFKLAGALKIDYVLERFVEAGAPAQALEAYRARLAQRHSNVHEHVAPTLGNAMPALAEDITIDRMPRWILEDWQESLQTSNVRRGPYGPAFGEDFEDDPVYREELTRKIRHGLGVQ